MKPVSACIAVGLLVAGCAGQATRPPITEVTRIPEQGDWFCQLGPSGEGWECVRDPELAEDPVPERLPERPAPPPSPTPSTLPEAPGPETPPIPESSPAPERSSVPGPAGSPPATAPADAGIAEVVGAAEDSTRPAYVRLAYQPAEPVPLTELPREFFTVQVLAMNSREEVEAFVQRHGIEGVSSARVEKDGKLYYVLLLGVYETLADAQRAVADLPPPFHETRPWIRPLGSLQAAIARAEALAESGP